jgi:hypothetical protein
MSNQNQNVKQTGGGATEWGEKVFGSMGSQVANTSGAIAVKGGEPEEEKMGGLGLSEAMVPVLLILANNTVSRSLLQKSGISRKTMKQTVPFVNGGNLANTIALPAGLIIANNMAPKLLASKPPRSTFRRRGSKRDRQSRYRKRSP